MERVAADFMATDGEPPWEVRGGHHIYVETGRQALALLADGPASSGRRRLLVPEYLCDSMISPFVGRGWSLRSYRMTPNLDIDHGDLLALARAQDGPLTVLLGLYFGREPDDAYRALVRELQLIGARVIDDETHRVLRPGNSGADFAIASLRKTLPVADGAYLRSAAEQDFVVGTSRPHSLRWAAMDQKRRYLDGELSEAGFPELFREANAALEADDFARAATARSLETIARLDYERLAQARAANARVLAAELGRAGIVCLNAPDQATIPSHLVVSVENPRAVQRRLAGMGIYCPIHWGPSELLSDVRSWPDNLLSLPVDHRYDATDMVRIAACLAEATA